MVFLKHRGFLFSELSKGCAAPTLAAFEDGCPPKPEAVIDAITKLRKKISRDLYEDRIRSQRANRCFTTNHKFHVRRSIHTGNYDQRVLYQPPSTSEIPTKIFFKYKNSVSSAELVN
uniref:Uncharacterized protein n=1 Tax=Solanum lycopersicum TaxID=4081 RepID=K4C4Y9_SOLLC